jgi:hypothetical protein
MENLKLKSSLILLLNFLIVSTVISQSNAFRVKAGGSGFTDTQGNYWAADRAYTAGEWGYMGGQMYKTTDPIQNTTNDNLYQTERFWLDAYRFTLPNGKYKITLKFAEIWYTRPNNRLFSVKIEEQYVFQDLDIYTTVGHDYALDYSYLFQVNDGRLDISFEHHEPYAHAKISAIEVVPASTSNPLPDINPQNLDFGGFLTIKKFIIHNNGDGDLSWNATESNGVSWLTSIMPNNGKIAGNTSQSVIVTINRNNLIEGNFQTDLNITSNGGNAILPVKIKVGLDTLRINGGGSQYTDIHGATWMDDFSFADGYTYRTSSSITNTTDPSLYQTERWGMTAYQFPVENNQSYEITLHFAEIYWKSAGRRTFDISLEDSLILDNYDIFAEVGANVATQKKFKVKIIDGNLDLNFFAAKDEPKISGIEIVADSQVPVLCVQPPALNFEKDQTVSNFIIINNGRDSLLWKASFNHETTWFQKIVPDSGILLAGDSTQVSVTISLDNLPDGTYADSILITSNGGDLKIPVTVVASQSIPYTQRVNAGGVAFMAVNGDVFAADQVYQSGSWGFIEGQTYSTSRAIGNTDDDQLYQSERWGLEGYIFDVPNGNYRIKLHFAEVYFSLPGKRIMDVAIENNIVLDNWDIFAEAGNRTAVVKAFTTSVTDNHLNIDFSASLDDPKISAIEIESIPPLLKVTAPELTIANSIIKPTSQYRMNQNYPNPFNLETTISYELLTGAHVNLTIFNELGQVQTELVNADQISGEYRFIWNGRDQQGIPVSSGVYFLSLFIKPIDSDAAPVTITRRTTLIK